VWILKQRNENNSYDNHNYNNCKGNRNNNTDRKRARLSVVMTLIHTQLCTARWKYVLGMRSVRVRGPWPESRNGESLVLGMKSSSWGSSGGLCEASVSLSCLHLEESQHCRMIAQLHPSLSRQTHVLGQIVHSGCRKHTDTWHEQQVPHKSVCMMFTKQSRDIKQSGVFLKGEELGAVHISRLKTRRKR